MSGGADTGWKDFDGDQKGCRGKAGVEEELAEREECDEAGC